MVLLSDTINECSKMAAIYWEEQRTVDSFFVHE